MDTGTGKTRTLVELINSVEGIDTVLYIAPYSAINPPAGVASVKDEVNKWGGFAARTEYTGAESIGSSDRIYLQCRDMLSRCKNPAIIVDESIKIKNLEAKRTRRIIDLSQLAEYKLIANATPVTRNLLDVWAQMEFLSPKILKMGIAEFENTFCVKTVVTRVKGGKMSQKEFVSGYTNIDYLYSIIGRYIYECDLDSKVINIDNNLHFSLSDTEAETYRLLKEKYLDNDFLMTRNNNIFLELTQKMQHTYSCSEQKRIMLQEVFEAHRQDRTAIYCKYIDSQRFCKKHFPKALVLGYQKNASSINLQYDYDNIVFWEKIWDYYLVKQAKGRIDRLGRKAEVHYFSFTGNVGLESLIDRSIDKKISMADYLRQISIEQLGKEL